MDLGARHRPPDGHAVRPVAVLGPDGVHGGEGETLHRAVAVVDGRVRMAQQQCAHRLGRQPFTADEHQVDPAEAVRVQPYQQVHHGRDQDEGVHTVSFDQLAQGVRQQMLLVRQHHGAAPGQHAPQFQPAGVPPDRRELRQHPPGREGRQRATVEEPQHRPVRSHHPLGGARAAGGEEDTGRVVRPDVHEDRPGPGCGRGRWRPARCAGERCVRDEQRRPQQAQQLPYPLVRPLHIDGAVRRTRLQHGQEEGHHPGRAGDAYRHEASRPHPASTSAAA